MFLIVIKICEPTGPAHGAPMEPLQGATFENPFRRPSLFIVTDFKPFSRGASNLFDCGKKL